MRKRKTLNSYSRELRGEPNNRYGGHQATRLRTYRGDWSKKYPCYSYSQSEILALEKTLHEQKLYGMTTSQEGSEMPGRKLS